ncbi:Smad nuclear-interacting protein 1 [Wickerhamiella sorbophila]|uniref:Smad nuclear-interacting protein 1 n=1 Tax=Wickerhamiella sorbophila TaxID=45607 RepID=A0A2T0FFF3_9ASCO|nr:Smad nuclear-interacting protein 1 [Wickerhamiella sorbophila]PRT53726.1 Smad nuclear-interacting protein 1 [Wickerhamiella sorbophila]
MTELEQRPVLVKQEIAEPSVPNRLLKSLLDATRKQVQAATTMVDGPNYKPSGVLAADAAAKGLTAQTNYAEPVDSCNPPANANQRLYTFENHDDIQSTIRLDNARFYTLGRSKACDIRVDHDTVADLHGVLQYRKVDDAVKIYLIDLSSPTGVLVNGTRAPSASFVELLNQDVIKLGSSETEFIFIDGNA